MQSYSLDVRGDSLAAPLARAVRVCWMTIIVPLFGKSIEMPAARNVLKQRQGAASCDATCAKAGEAACLQTQYAELQRRKKAAAHELSDAKLETVLHADL